MKRKLLGIAVFASALLMMLATFTSVSAEPQKWIPVTVTRTGLNMGVPTEVWITEGNTLHGRGGTGGFTAFEIVGQGVDLNGRSESTYDFNINLNNGRGVFHWVITLIFPDGTFEGSVQVAGTYDLVNNMPNSIDAVQSGTFHGTGNYQGWTFKIEIAPGNVITASMLIP